MKGYCGKPGITLAKSTTATFDPASVTAAGKLSHLRSATPKVGHPHKHCNLQHRRRQQRKNNATMGTMLYITDAIDDIDLSRNVDS